MLPGYMPVGDVRKRHRRWLLSPVPAWISVFIFIAVHDSTREVQEQHRAVHECTYLLHAVGIVLDSSWRRDGEENLTLSRV